MKFVLILLVRSFFFSFLFLGLSVCFLGFYFVFVFPFFGVFLCVYLASLFFVGGGVGGVGEGVGVC